MLFFPRERAFLGVPVGFSAHTSLWKQDAALRVPREKRVHQKALITFSIRLPEIFFAYDLVCGLFEYNTTGVC